MFEKLLGKRGKKEAGDATTPGEIAERERYGDLELLARPIREGNVWRIAGSVCRGEGDTAEQQDFIRADTTADHEEAVRMCLLKGRQLVDDRGESLFSGNGSF